jgi:hypothetical protein
MRTSTRTDDRPRKGAAGSWLFGIASRKLADAQRRGYAERRVCRRLGMERIVRVRSSTVLPEFGSADMARSGEHLWISSPAGRVMIVRR